MADVNTNPDNPVIGQRSAGEDPQRVAATAVALMRGLQAGRVAAVAKHFPGHGNTSVDSHASLPVLGHSYHHLDSVDLMPFRALIDSGVVGVMSATARCRRASRSACCAMCCATASVSVASSFPTP